MQEKAMPRSNAQRTEATRQALIDAAGPDGTVTIEGDHGTLTLAPHCRRLIAALRTYHFDARHPTREEPVKDGPDHLCDALRYLVVNLEAASPVRVRGW